MVQASGFSPSFVLVGLDTMERGRQHRIRSGRIVDTETTRIRDVRPGTVEVNGRARPAEESAVFGSPICRRQWFFPPGTLQRP
jgi:hypothetical protein